MVHCIGTLIFVTAQFNGLITLPNSDPDTMQKFPHWRIQIMTHFYIGGARTCSMFTLSSDKNQTKNVLSANEPKIPILNEIHCNLLGIGVCQYDKAINPYLYCLWIQGTRVSWRKEATVSWRVHSATFADETRRCSRCGDVSLVLVLASTHFSSQHHLCPR